MPIRLTSQNNTYKTIIVTDLAWFSLLDLAQDYGWNPYGPVLPGQWQTFDLDHVGYTLGEGDYGQPAGDESSRRLVILDDALNLADALERAFMDYEPRRVPTSFYLFAPDAGDPTLGLGVLREVIELSQYGAFWLESYPA